MKRILIWKYQKFSKVLLKGIFYGIFRRTYERVQKRTNSFQFLRKSAKISNAGLSRVFRKIQNIGHSMLQFFQRGSLLVKGGRSWSIQRKFMVYDKNQFSSASWTVLWKINYNCPVRFLSWPRKIKNFEFQIDKKEIFRKKLLYRKIVFLVNFVLSNMKDTVNSCLHSWQTINKTIMVRRRYHFGPSPAAFIIIKLVACHVYHVYIESLWWFMKI